MNTFFKLLLLIKTLRNFPTAIADRFGFLKGMVTYTIRHNNLRFLARAGTEDMAEIVVVASGYEYNMNKVKLPANPVIVDLGGHIGSFSLYMASLLKNNCRIYTFEPATDNYKILKKNVALNNIKSMHTKNIAISDYDGKGYLKTKNMNNDAYYLDTSQKKTPNCLINRFPTAMKEFRITKIDLLKMDIEGGEYKIFQHIPTFNYLKKNVHYILLEYHNLDADHNYSHIKKIIKNHFRTLHRRPNVVTLENLHWNYSNQ